MHSIALSERQREYMSSLSIPVPPSWAPLLTRSQVTDSACTFLAVIVPLAVNSTITKGGSFLLGSALADVFAMSPLCFHIPTIIIIGLEVLVADRRFPIPSRFGYFLFTLAVCALHFIIAMMIFTAVISPLQ